VGAVTVFTILMSIASDRSNVRVVRLADLDREFPRPQARRGLGGWSEQEAHERLGRALAGAPDEPVRASAPKSDWIGVPPTSGRAPHPIGSTLPGPLGDDDSLFAPSAAASEAPPAAAAPAKPARSPQRPAKDVPRLPPGVVLKLPVRFHATGAEYARIWLGNLLLMVFTLGLAWPWVYRRREQFFLRHTQVGGHRLDFRLSPKVMWPRAGMTAALCLGVAGAMAGSLWTGLAALTLAALVWPLLAYLKLNHKVASVMWAGRRFWFDGHWQGMYRAFSASVMVAVAGVWLGAMAWQDARPVWWMAAVACWAVWVLSAPLAVWAYLQFRQQHLRLGPLQLLWKVPRSALWRWLGRTAAWAALVGLGLAGVASLVLAAGLVWARTMGSRGLPGGVVWVGAGLCVLALAAAVWPHAQAHLINLVWNKTGNRHLRFRSQIKVSAYVQVYAKNALRLVLTLGLYWPWAVVNLRRMRMHSLQVWSRVEPEVLLAHWSARQTEAAPLPVSPVSVMPDMVASLAKASRQASVGPESDQGLSRFAPMR
jgi:uncharacterized membrane protein YjgN (DUF898 family)